METDAMTRNAKIFWALTPLLALLALAQSGGGKLAHATSAPVWSGGENPKFACPINCGLSTLRVVSVIDKEMTRFIY